MSATTVRSTSRGRAAVIVFLATRSSGLSPDLAAVHDATAKYEDVSSVEAAGYAELLDAEGIACIDHGEEGGMGIHYVHGDLVGDATLDPERPEAIIYEPQESGAMELVGVEYVVFQEAWDAANDSPPSLFGQELIAVGADNRYGIPAFYELHAWVWKDNPAGVHADYNPEVSCAHADAMGAMHGGAHEPAAPFSPAVTPRERLGGW